MKPFNLEAALRGEPVVTRDGQEVKQLTLFDVASNFVVYAVVEGCVMTFNKEGKFYQSSSVSPLDLFMAPKKRTVWVNLYKDGTYYFHNSEKVANDAVVNSPDYRIGGKAYLVEIEE